MLTAKLVRRAHKSERGAILVFSAILLLMLIGFAALAVDLSNAWSNDQLGQNNADVAASGALFRVPRTFVTTPPGGGLLVQDEAEAEVADLLSINVDAGMTANSVTTVTFPPDAAEVTVDVTIDSVNAFARAIGGGADVPVDSTATSHVEVQPTTKLLPLGFYRPVINGQSGSGKQPYQCLNVDVAGGTATPRVCGGQGGFSDGSSNGLLNRLLGMTRLGASPVSCSVDTVFNFVTGVDHLVDSLDEGIRTEGNACAHGHFLTLPSAADQLVLIPFSTVLDDATIGAGAPLAAASNPLWTYLRAGNSGACDPANTVYTDPAVPLEDKSNLMRDCLRSWNGSAQLFNSGVVQSPRFGYGIDIREDGTAPEEFERAILVFLNTLVPDVGPLDDPLVAQFLDGTSFPAGSADVGGLTMFSIARNMLSSSDRNALVSPFYHVDRLEFTLVD
jgi:Flp pilus assembly protein TadG